MSTTEQGSAGTLRILPVPAGILPAGPQYPRRYPRPVDVGQLCSFAPRMTQTAAKSRSRLFLVLALLMSMPVASYIRARQQATPMVAKIPEKFKPI